MLYALPDPLAAALLAMVAALVGVFIGTVGVGGVLLIPFLVVLGGLDIHSAAATALVTFLFTGLLGTVLFQRRGSIRWRLAVPLCGGAAAAGYFGSAVAARIDAGMLTLIIAGLVVAAGAYILRPASAGDLVRERHGDGLPLLLGVGVVSGFGSGLSGAGGPLFSVPIMVILGFSPIAAVGASQVLQIVAAASGSLAGAQDGRIVYGLAAWVTVFELIGVAVGVRLAHAASAVGLRRAAGVLCIGVGVLMLLRTYATVSA